MSLYRLIGGFVVRHWRAYIACGLMLIGIAVMTVWVPRLVGQAVDGLVGGTLGGAALAMHLLWLVGMGAAIYFLRVGWRLQLFSAAYQLGVELRTRLYNRLALQGPPFFQRSRTGDLMARATNDVDSIEMAAGEAFLAGFDGTLTLILVIAMMAFGIDWRLAAVALLPFPLMAIAFWFISRRVHTAWRESLDRFSNLNDHVQETVAGVRTVRALGLEASAGTDFARHASAAAAANFDALKWEAAYEPAVGLTLTVATALTLGVGGWLVWQQQLTVGELTSFTMYLAQLIWPMFAAGWVLSLLERGKAAWARLQPVLNEPLSVVDRGTFSRLPPGTLRFENVTFGYRGSAAPAVVDVSFELHHGQTLGIVGPTGAGKSTLLALLLRHYAPDSGRISWSGQSIDQYSLDALHAAISWVPQEPFLFSATLAENIALARSDAAPAEIEHAVQLAALADDIARFPHGYETVVGERGITLSGGQRQRVAIARALLTDKPLLLLDDALSAVDTGTEMQILAHLRGELRSSNRRRSIAHSPLGHVGETSAAAHGGRAAIIVSHRLSAVADADTILVIKAGAIVERGTHDELLRIGGWYAAQWRYQQLEASLEAA